MILDTHIEVEELRAVAYKRLSTCYYLPEQETLDQLGDLEAALSQICPEAVADVASMRQEADLRSTQDRLFAALRWAIQVARGPIRFGLPGGTAGGHGCVDY